MLRAKFGKPGNSNENIIDIPENMFLLHMTRSGARIGFSPGATPPIPYKLMSDEIAVLFCADENVDRKTSKHDNSLLRELSKVEDHHFFVTIVSIDIDL